MLKKKLKKKMLKRLQSLNEEINMIESGEKMQLSEVDKKISEEEMELISALEEEIKIKTIFSNVKKKIEKDKQIKYDEF